MAGGLFGQFLSISWRQAGKTAPTHQAAIVQDPPQAAIVQDPPSIVPIIGLISDVTALM
jgi:hypothetical protein